MRVPSRSRTKRGPWPTMNSIGTNPPSSLTIKQNRVRIVVELEGLLQSRSSAGAERARTAATKPISVFLMRPLTVYPTGSVPHASISAADSWWSLPSGSRVYGLVVGQTRHR